MKKAVIQRRTTSIKITVSSVNKGGTSRGLT